jgi:hydroxymethylpyrimidine/phosphomethylpyrimidine kinase
MARTRPVALTVAGTDSGGGAGVLADAAVFRASGVWPTAAIAAVTAQNTLGVDAVAVMDPGLVLAQIEAVVRDIGVDAVKTGMLGNHEVVSAVAAGIAGLPSVVVDPVLASSSGTPLLDADGIDVLRSRLLPLATIVTPNLAEAAALTALPVTDRDGMAAAAEALVGMGARAALVTGGHLPGDTVADCLVAGGRRRWFEAPRHASVHTHGTGCVLSAAITARLACGDDLEDAVEAGRAAVRQAIERGLALGSGVGPVDGGDAVSSPAW